MRRAIALCTAVASLAVVGPAQAGYYVIRWDNTGICQIWNDTLTFKPLRWPADYKIASKPVPTFSDAVAVQENLRHKGRCTV